MPQIGATQPSVIQIRALQIGVAEIRLSKIGAPQRETLQLGMRKVGFFAALPAEVSQARWSARTPCSWSNDISLSTG